MTRNAQRSGGLARRIVAALLPCGFADTLPRGHLPGGQVADGGAGPPDPCGKF
jgi:hypothetical protein